jgi:tRNA modification GTPase
MFSTTDTIAAIATPPGPGGLGVVRVSGPEARPIACALLARDRPLRPRHATLARVYTVSGAPIDHAVVTLFAAPHSYTSEDVVEISVHGSPVVLRAVLESALAHGARLARPGEFTFRAFIHERIQLTQAEAVADLIEAATPHQARLAYGQLDGSLAWRIGNIEGRLFDLIARLEASLDFPDEGYRFITADEIGLEVSSIANDIEALLRGSDTGRIVREGATVVLAGAPNSGKSSLFNALVGYSRSIVADVPGTTRDLVTETVDIAGIPVRLTDTAGLHESGDIVEQEGVARAEHASASAHLTLRVLDRSNDLKAQLASWPVESAGRHIWVINKTDAAGWHWAGARAGTSIEVSAARRTGIDVLGATIGEALVGARDHVDEPLVTNVRHIQLLRSAAETLRRVPLTSGNPPSEEFLLVDLAEARAAFDELSGRRGADAVLERIFERFCVGK